MVKVLALECYQNFHPQVRQQISAIQILHKARSNGVFDFEFHVSEQVNLSPDNTRTYRNLRISLLNPERRMKFSTAEKVHSQIQHRIKGGPPGPGPSTLRASQI